MEPQGRGVVQQHQQPADVEDVCITASSGNTNSIHQMAQDLQLARKKLAAKIKPSANMVSLSSTVIRGCGTLAMRLYCTSGQKAWMFEALRSMIL